MAARRRPRKREGFLESQDKILRLNTLYRTPFMGAERLRQLAARAHADFDDVGRDEPDEELVDSELSDSERREAIARERLRREGKA
jgi:hypothetical protein